VQGPAERRGKSFHSQETRGGVDTRPPSDRLFFAVHPDLQTARRIVAVSEALRAKHGLHGKPIPAERLHVTLHHLGDHSGLPEPVIAAAGVAAAQITMTPFEVRFGRVASLGGGARGRPCVLRSEAADANPELLALQDGLAGRLREAGLGRYVGRHFTPHVTLLYAESAVAEAVSPVDWPVRGFALVHSLLGRGQHRILQSWPLT
jgi:RNA 2',3'-cyclic 3'-phosphodiesterase